MPVAVCQFSAASTSYAITLKSLPPLLEYIGKAHKAEFYLQRLTHRHSPEFKAEDMWHLLCDVRL